jgi:hypothetical protein
MIERECNADWASRLLQLRPTRRDRPGTAKARKVESLVWFASERHSGQQLNWAPYDPWLDLRPQFG